MKEYNIYTVKINQTETTMTTVMNLSNPKQKMYFSSSPKMAVIGAYATSLHDNNTWQWEERYSHLIVEGKHCVACGDWSAFKDGRDF